MSDLNFDRAEYLQPQEPQILQGEGAGRPVTQAEGPFINALLFGAIAAVAGSIAYALISLSGFMVSIVAIAMAWLIAKAMMTTSNGIGGQRYQIAAVILTYFSVSLGELLAPLWRAHGEGLPLSHILVSPQVWKFFLIGPFLELERGFNGIIGIVILVIGMRAAWRMAAGGPGFMRRSAVA